jgi:drug/metabolite transporter (DMT)-like permease
MTSNEGTERSERAEVRRGVALALGSAVAFGLSTPWVARAGSGLGPFATACLLYAGAALAATLLRTFLQESGAPLRVSHLRRLAGIAAAGAFVAPVCFAWGIQRTGPATGALLLNLEAGFTTLLAARFLGEPIGRRVAWALVAMAAGGTLLVLDHGGETEWSMLGAGAVALAAASWAVDNLLSRPMAECEPLAVVGGKASLGAAASLAIALAAGEAMPSMLQALALLACGATGYGLSLRLYLLAQRRVGAGRTASVFAVAPFLGAVASWILGDPSLGLVALGGTAAFALGVYLHATERHDHTHVHGEQDHEHAHVHDDGHHAHAHATPVLGSHAHAHRHGRIEHRHEHAPDVHHDHHGRRRERSPA